MATPKVFWIYDSDGAPLEGVVPQWVDFVTRAGGTRTRPAIVELGGGQYSILPTDADEAVGCIALIDTVGDNLPSYVCLAISTLQLPFSAVVRVDVDGNLSSGAPVVGSYVGIGGDPFIAPPPVQAGAITYLFSISPPAEDLAIGVTLRIDGGQYPFVNEVLVARASSDTTPPTITLLSPGEGALPNSTTAIAFTATDASGFRRILVLVEFTASGGYEVIHDGDEFADAYAGNSSKTAITNGFTFSVLRAGGWPPGPFRLRALAIDVSGNED